MITRALIVSVLLFTTAAHAADSPQFRGPHRDGKFEETGLLKAWPEGGPALLWKSEGLGKGYSSVSVVNGTIYTAGMAEDNQGYIFALDLDGKLKWKAPYGVETLEKMASGSRSTPTIDGDRIYIMSGVGGVACLALDGGKLHWQVDAATKFQAAPVVWEFSESPLVYGNLVYAAPGGPDASVVALDKMTGETVWTSKGVSEPSGYCSPTIFRFGTRDVLITMLAESMVCLDPRTGQRLWTHHHKIPYDIHANTPVGTGTMLYYTAETGGGVLDIAPDGSSATQRWTNSELDNVHHGVVLHEGYLYGSGYRNRSYYCLDFQTGKTMWSAKEIDQGNTVFADGMLYVYEGPKTGQVSLLKPRPEKFERTGTLQIPQAKDKHWAHPVVANGRLYIRYDGVLYAYDVQAK
jgi:outer membrane protein assembly factor BamB